MTWGRLFCAAGVVRGEAEGGEAPPGVLGSGGWRCCMKEIFHKGWRTGYFPVPKWYNSRVYWLILEWRCE